MSLPELFGSYLLQHRLVKGTISEVYLAQTIGDYPRLCAVKCIRPEVASLSGFGDRFKADAALLVRMIHGNLVQVLEVGQVEERLFVAMEHIDGVDLSHLIAQVPRQGPLPPELALYVGLEMCEAVTYIQRHRQAFYASVGDSIPHDAPWPLEVMLAFDGVVKIIDMGSFGAIHLGQQKVQKLFQSPGYAVPEVVLRRPLDARSDLFAIGLVLWELLEGRRLVAVDPEGYVRDVLAGSWKAPLITRKDVSGDVIRLVASMLNLEPERRPVGIEQARDRLVAGLRRLSPAFGSAAVAQLLEQRCQEQIRGSEQLIQEVVRRTPTERHVPTAVSTLSFGQAGKVDRQVAEPVKLKTGDVIPGTRYRVVRKVGQGGSAQVFAAQHVDLDRQVAIKILSSELASNSEAIAQFRLEARTCARVGHPNIIEVIDFGELEDGRFYFAMELLDGVSLADQLDHHGALPVGRALGIFRQITKALQAAHRHGIVHRDIKPENVMLVQSPEGRADFVKLLDFGVMAFGPDTRKMAVGTTGYMAPEQVQGAQPSPAMDIYAVGTTLYEALSGQIPYPAETYPEFVRDQAKQPPPALRSLPGAEHIPSGLERVIHRALERDPGARHPSMADLEAELIHAQREAGIQTEWDDLPPPGELRDRRKTVSAEVLPFRRRPRLAWVGLGAAALVLVVGGVVLLSARSRSAQPPPPQAVRKQAPPSKGAVQAEQRRPTPERRPSLPPPLQELLKRAQEAAAAGRFSQPEGDSAWDLLRRIEEQAPGDEQVVATRRRIAATLEGAGDRLASAGLRRAARTLYDEALQFAPQSKRLASLVSATVSRHRSKKIGKRPTANITEVAWLLSQVQLAVVEGRYLKPPGRNALFFLSRLKQVDPAGRRMGEAQRNLSRILRRQADGLFARGQGSDAQPIYRLIAALDPADRLARRRAAPSAGASSPVRRTKVDRERVAKLVSEGRAFLKDGKLIAAEGRFQAAVEAQPKDSEPLIGLATVAFERARYFKSVELARRAVTISPRSMQGHLLLGDGYFKLHQYSKALAAWSKARKLDPGNQRLAKRIEHVERRMRAPRGVEEGPK